MKRVVLAMIGLAALAACEPTLPETDVSAPRAINLPERVIELAAPGQDLATARVLEQDGCYWYAHRNVVETTLLPLRSREGRPICTRSQAEATIPVS
ncbi:MAG: hypothetical protein ACU0DW_00475 [Shimia sp.]